MAPCGPVLPALHEATFCPSHVLDQLFQSQKSWPPRREIHGGARCTRSVEPTSYAVVNILFPGKEHWSVVALCMRLRWSGPCGRLIDACQQLPHYLALPFPMYTLHLELCKGEKKELHNLTFYWFVISVPWPTKAFHNEEREKYNPKQQGRETKWVHCSSPRLPSSASLLFTILLSWLTVSGFPWILHSLRRSGEWGVLCTNHTNNWLLALSSSFLHFSIAYPDCLHQLSRLGVRPETKPCGNHGHDGRSSIGLACIQLFLAKAQVSATIWRRISI